MMRGGEMRTPPATFAGGEPGASGVAAGAAGDAGGAPGLPGAAVGDAGRPPGFAGAPGAAVAGAAGGSVGVVTATGAGALDRVTKNTAPAPPMSTSTTRTTIAPTSSGTTGLLEL